jgi:hypothetical protein
MKAIPITGAVGVSDARVKATTIPLRAASAVTKKQGAGANHRATISDDVSKTLENLNDAISLISSLEGNLFGEGESGEPLKSAVTTSLESMANVAARDSLAIVNALRSITERV